MPLSLMLITGGLLMVTVGVLLLFKKRWKTALVFIILGALLILVPPVLVMIIPM